MPYSHAVYAFMSVTCHYSIETHLCMHSYLTHELQGVYLHELHMLVSSLSLAVHAFIHLCLRHDVFILYLVVTLKVEDRGKFLDAVTTLLM